MRGLLPAALALVLAGTPPAAAQDLFELEVFEFDTTPKGTYGIGLHTNGVPQPDIDGGASASAHRPVHLSAEVLRGWTDRFDTAVFIQTAPFGASAGHWIAGGHVRARVALVDEPAFPFKVALSGEYGFNRPSWDDELQTFEVTPILERRMGRMSLILNPSMELVVLGDEGQSPDPSFAIAARTGWSFNDSLSVAVDYFSRSGTTRHFAADDPAHHLIFPTIDVGLNHGWTLSLGAGHCITSSEPWIFRSILGFEFAP